GVRTGTGAEKHIRLGKFEVRKEGVGHLRVVVLAGVDEGDRDLFRPLPANRIELAARVDDWRRLHEVGARTNDDEDLHTKIIPLISGLGQLIFRYVNLRNNGAPTWSVDHVLVRRSEIYERGMRNGFVLRRAVQGCV